MPDQAQGLTLAGAAWSFGAGLGGAAIPLGVMWLKLRLDQLSARCDTFVEFIEQVAELGLDYWLIGEADPTATLPADDADESKERAAAILKHEIQLRGAQTILQLDISRMARDLPAARREPLRKEFAELVSALTGGRFGDRSGYAEPHKAQAVVSAAARIIRLVREGRDDVSRLPNMLRFAGGRL